MMVVLGLRLSAWHRRAIPGRISVLSGFCLIVTVLQRSAALGRYALY